MAQMNHMHLEIIAYCYFSGNKKFTVVLVAVVVVVYMYIYKRIIILDITNMGKNP